MDEPKFLNLIVPAVGMTMKEFLRTMLLGEEQGKGPIFTGITLGGENNKTVEVQFSCQLDLSALEKSLASEEANYTALTVGFNPKDFVITLIEEKKDGRQGSKDSKEAPPSAVTSSPEVSKENSLSAV